MEDAQAGARMIRITRLRRAVSCRGWPLSPRRLNGGHLAEGKGKGPADRRVGLKVQALPVVENGQFAAGFQAVGGPRGGEVDFQRGVSQLHFEREATHPFPA